MKTFRILGIPPYLLQKFLSNYFQVVAMAYSIRYELGKTMPAGSIMMVLV